MPLLAALAVRRGDVVAVAGAGGKTTLCYRLAQEAQEAGLRVLVTTTTHMGTLPEATTGPVFVEAEGGELGLAEALGSAGRATLLGRRVRPDKLEGVLPERVDALAPLADLVVVEADGARGRSLKVPAAHEPVVPSSATLLVVVAALDVLGRPLDEEAVHRVGLVGAMAGVPAGAPVDETAVAAALRAPGGYPSRFREGLRTAVFLNKAEDPAALACAGRIAAAVCPPYDRLAAGSARSGQARAWP
jgi:probable selenium-dependent hydroxylase accessory protein YqeC